jgi:hypothetical protein
MVRLAAIFLRRAAPTELKGIVEWPAFYKHVAPPELKPGRASAILPQSGLTPPKPGID